MLNGDSNAIRTIRCHANKHIFSPGLLVGNHIFRVKRWICRSTLNTNGIAWSATESFHIFEVVKKTKKQNRNFSNSNTVFRCIHLLHWLLISLMFPICNQKRSPFKLATAVGNRKEFLLSLKYNFETVLLFEYFIKCVCCAIHDERKLKRLAYRYSKYDFDLCHNYYLILFYSKRCFFFLY